MLLFAKKYDEEILPWIFNGLKEAYKNNNEYIVNFIINKELKNKDSDFIEKLKKYCSETISKYTLQPVVRYGDSVTSYTPIYIKVNNQVEILTIDQLGEKYGNNNWIKYNDKESCELNNILTWSDSGWTNIYRVIRHQLESQKKILRICTLQSIVDVTDDHSLLLFSKNIKSPKDIKKNIDMLCLNELKELSNNNKFNKVYSINVSTMIEAAYYINYLNSINYSNYNILYSEDNCIIIKVGLSINENTALVKSINEINYSGYVYDLTTNNHHFAAGVGNLIVNNTDSVFACFRFKEQNDELNSSDSLELFKKIVEFGEDLIKPFFLPKEQILFSELYKKYYSYVNELTLPEYPICSPIPNHNNIILPIEDRMKQFLKEYLYENYLSWLWTLQEIINKSYSNINIKLFDWAEYLLSKYRFTYNDLCDNRKDEIIIPLTQKIESFYKINTDNFNWHKSNNDEITDVVQLIEVIFKNEIIKTTKEIHKLVKNFLDVTLLEEWIYSENQHDVKLTKEKKKLKRERKYNDKYLPELLNTFIISKLKCNFNKHKNNHHNKVINFIQNILKEYIIQPYWDIIDNKIIYKIKIFNQSTPIIDKRTLDFSIELGELSGELVKSHLPFPHDLEYEKTFWPFLILTKKHYVGNKYEFDSNKYKQDFMGIVLKRRDNAPIVKEICSGIIDNLINKRDPEGAKNFTENALLNMFESKYDIKYFLQSRTLKLKESYVDWTKIAHVFLAEKIAAREGSKPESGNRIEFAAICVPEHQNGTKLLQGEMIETPAFIKEHNIPINYMFYMKNQIMNPALQFLSLVDKNSSEKIFKNFEEKYSIIKPKKIIKLKITEDDLELENIIKNKNKSFTDTDDTISEKKPIKKKKSLVEKIIGESFIKTIPTEEQTLINIELTNNNKKVLTKKSIKNKKLLITENNSIDEPLIIVPKKKKIKNQLKNH